MWQSLDNCWKKLPLFSKLSVPSTGKPVKESNKVPQKGRDTENKQISRLHSDWGPEGFRSTRYEKFQTRWRPGLTGSNVSRHLTAREAARWGPHPVGEGTQRQGHRSRWGRAGNGWARLPQGYLFKNIIFFLKRKSTYLIVISISSEDTKNMIILK